VLLIIGAVVLRRRRGQSTTLPPPMLAALRITLGIIFIILGIIGAFVPIMQGWIFMLLAVLVLFPQSRFAIRSLDKVETKMPRAVAWLRRLGVGVHREPHD
jgi:uncharacterized protein